MEQGIFAYCYDFFYKSFYVEDLYFIFVFFNLLKYSTLH